MTKSIRVTLLSIALAGSSSAYAANLITNGSFEDPAVPQIAILAPGDTSMPGWTVAALPGSDPLSNIHLLNNNLLGAAGVVASTGVQFVDLTGDDYRGGGIVSNAFATVAGQNYTVSFDVGAAWVAGAGSFGDATVDAYLNGVLVSSFTNILTLTAPGTSWKPVSYNFTGSGAPTTISFYASLSPASSFRGVGVDNVVVDLAGAVPEPATWGSMLIGFALTGAALRRKKQATRISPANA